MRWLLDSVIDLGNIFIFPGPRSADAEFLSGCGLVVGWPRVSRGPANMKIKFDRPKYLIRRRCGVNVVPFHTRSNIFCHVSLPWLWAEAESRLSRHGESIQSVCSTCPTPATQHTQLWREVALMENMEKKDEIPSLDQHLKGREYLLFVQEPNIFTQNSINISQRL